jgi:phosphatidate phosphatase LPIN
MWDYTKKIVISDVDGTITKSDMLGHVLPRLGQADLTRDYIKGIKQDNVFVMPDGPVILSPDRLLRSFKREIIHR